MTSAVQSPYSGEQISAWLRGLLTIAWADGHFDPEEQDLIASLTQTELAPQTSLGSLEPIAPEELADILGHDPKMAENFLRTAVMVAIADGIYSQPEDQMLQRLCHAFGQESDILESLRLTLTDDQDGQELQPGGVADGLVPPAEKPGRVVPLRPVQEWLDQLEIHDPRLARFLCKMIPPQCPFERDVQLFGHKVVHIPPMCKLNPLYDQLVGLRFRALSYLADDCGEDVTPYC